MFGPNAHPRFAERFVRPQQAPGKALIRGSLPLGNISYYLQGAHGLSTRVFLYNYYRLMCDADIPAAWQIRCFTRTGELAAETSGVLQGHGSTVVELSSLTGLDTFGILRVSVTPASPETFLPQPHASLFYNECYLPNTEWTVMAHSLHIPMAAHGPMHQRVASGLHVPYGFRPSLFLASGCSFHRFGHPACTTAMLTFVNARGQDRKLAVEPMTPLACQELDLFAMDPGLAAHIGNDPFILKVTGEQVLAKPFIFLTDGKTVMGEHL